MFWRGVNGILISYAKKDLNILIHKESNFAKIRNIIVKELKKLSYKELINEKYEINSYITYLELYNIDNFVSIRFTFYALVVAIVVIIKGLDLQPYLNLIFGVLTIMLISFRCTSDIQKDRKLYYKFKLECIDELLKDNQKQGNKR